MFLFYSRQYFPFTGSNPVPVHQLMSLAKSLFIIYTGNYIVQAFHLGIYRMGLNSIIFNDQNNISAIFTHFAAN